MRALLLWCGALALIILIKACGTLLMAQSHDTTTAGVASLSTRDGRLTLEHLRGAPHIVLRGHTDSTTSILKSDDDPACFRLSVNGGGILQLLTTGHWYGGPSMAHALWPTSLNTIRRQRWRSNDMLGDRESLGSVLEGTWLTSAGALVRILSGDFEFSFNQPGGCSSDGGTLAPPTAEGSLCVFAAARQPAAAAAAAASTPGTEGVEVEVCAAADARAAAELLLKKLPRPIEPQQPSRTVMRAPVWSTWARFKMEVDQAKAEAYGAEIAARGFPRSHFEVDDRWSPKYGDLAFDTLKFPDAAGMVRKLHAHGFSVTLWVTPFAEPASEAYAEGAAGGHWLRGPDGSPLRITWWQGEGVALNVSDAAACRWFERRLRALMEATGVDGFKFDAGEAVFVPEGGGIRAPRGGVSVFVPEGAMADPNAYCARWAGLAARFGGGGEVRCADHSQSAGVWTREFDKDSRWGRQNGLRALLVSALQLGVLGYPFVLPDMVGGNAYSDEMLSSSGGGAGAGGDGGSVGGGSVGGDSVGGANATQEPKLAVASDMFFGALPPRELYIRWCFANALLPAVQFSIAPWQYDDAVTHACRRALELRASRLPTIEALASEAAATGAPIVRPMWWADPLDPTCQWVDDQFMLGDRTLVAPVLDPGVTSRTVYLPRGTWRADHGARQVVAGPRWLVDVSVPLDALAVFDRVLEEQAE